jgi:hypothetical protein
LVTTTKTTWKPKNPDEGDRVRGHATGTTATRHVTQDADALQGTLAPRMTINEAMRMSLAQDEVAGVAVGMSQMETIHAENAVMCRLGWKPSNYSWMPISRTTKIRRVVEAAAAVEAEGDNHSDVFAGWFSATRS